MMKLFLCVYMMIIIASSQSPLCSNGVQNANLANWIILHENCWGKCVNTDNSGSPSAAKSCGTRAGLADPQNEVKPKCGFTLQMGKKMKRSYCGVTPNHHLAQIGGGQSNGHGESCKVDVCTNGNGHSYKQDAYCRSDNRGGAGASIDTAYPCPPGTERGLILACSFRQGLGARNNYKGGTVYYQQQYSCKVTAHKISYKDEAQFVYAGVLTVEQHGGKQQFRFTDGVYTRIINTNARVSEDNMLNEEYDQYEELDEEQNMAIIKRELKDARMRIKKVKTERNKQQKERSFRAIKGRYN